MLENTTHNLLMQLGQENKSLYRIKEHYLKDCEGDQVISEFWQRMAQDKESHIKELKSLVAERL